MMLAVSDGQNPNASIYKQHLVLWTRNAAANLWQITKYGLNATLLEHIYEKPEQTCIVCGRGPSLDEALQKHKEKFPKYPVIACLSALPALIANGIRPLYVVAYDSKANAIDHIAGIDTGQLSLITTTTIHPLLITSWRGPIFFFNGYHKGYEFFEVTLPTLYGQFPSYWNAGCVVNMSVVLAADVMKFSQVYLIGAEYPLDNERPYVSANYEHDEDGTWERVETSSSDVSPDLVRAHTRYREVLIAWTHKFKLPVVNCSPYASFKEDIAFKSFAEI